jgi:5-hydroxyisourate hydrolase
VACGAIARPRSSSSSAGASERDSETELHEALSQIAAITRLRIEARCRMNKLIEAAQARRCPAAAHCRAGDGWRTLAPACRGRRRGPRRAAAPAGLATAPTSMAGVSPRLTFHAVDTFSGATAAGLEDRALASRRREVGTAEDRAGAAGGRPAEPLLIGEEYRTGRYEVLMHLDEYFARVGAKLPQPFFLSKVPLRFVITDASQRVHLPVLFSPWGYSYYRGS